jgi:hypothetical protein
MEASDMIPTRRYSRGRPRRLATLLRIGGTPIGLAVWVTPQLSLAAGNNPALLELASAGLTDAEMAYETGAGLDAPVPVPTVTSPQPKIILWDELHHSSQSGIVTDAATVTIRVFP